MPRFHALGKCVKSVPHKSVSASKKGNRMITRREFIAAAGAADKSSRLFLPDDDLKPSTNDRLPLEWHKQRAKLLQEKLAQDSHDGILLTDRWNIIYFTGLWHTTTERLVNVFLPLKAEPVWFNAALDRDLVNSCWYSDGEMYFDWFHAEGAFPN